MKSLFTEKGHYTEEAKDIAYNVEMTLKALIEQYGDKFNLREIETVCHQALHTKTSREIVKRNRE